MKKICFLAGRFDRLDHANIRMLANAALRRGMKVSLGEVNSLTLAPDGISGRVRALEEEMPVEAGFSEDDFSFQRLDTLDLIWPLSFGDRALYLDTIELFWLLEKRVPFVNSVNALMFLNNKYISSGYMQELEGPKTYASCDADYVESVMHENPKDKWIIKPPAESFGRGVFRVGKEDSNSRPLMEFLSDYKGRRYILLQEYLDSSDKKEKRVLMVGEEIVLAYAKSPAAGEHRANLHSGASSAQTELSKDEEAMCRKIGGWCAGEGANFVGIDLLYPKLIEINVVSPGGLATWLAMGEEDVSEKVIELVLRKVTRLG